MLYQIIVILTICPIIYSEVDKFAQMSSYKRGDIPHFNEIDHERENIQIEQEWEYVTSSIHKAIGNHQSGTYVYKHPDSPFTSEALRKLHPTNQKRLEMLGYSIKISCSPFMGNCFLYISLSKM